MKTTSLQILTYLSVTLSVAALCLSFSAIKEAPPPHTEIPELAEGEASKLTSEEDLGEFMASKPIENGRCVIATTSGYYYAVSYVSGTVGKRVRRLSYSDGGMWIAVEGEPFMQAFCK